MVLSLLREMKGLAAPPRRKGTVIQDLEFAMRAKGGMSPEEEARLRVISMLPRAASVLVAGVSCFGGWFAIHLAHKLAGVPPTIHGLLPKIGHSAGLAYLMGKAMYIFAAHACAEEILQSEYERMKMELANIILTDYSDDEILVEAVKSSFVSEHMFDDQHQDKPMFRWHPRRSYVDSAYVERMKEIEASNSYDEARTISGQTTLNMSFGDLTEDPFACILGSPGGDMENNTAPKKTGTVLKRSELRARRRSHRHHHHRHADRLTLL